MASIICQALPNPPRPRAGDAAAAAAAAATAAVVLAVAPARTSKVDGVVGATWYGGVA